MTHPYRTPPDERPPPPQTDVARLRSVTFAFGFLCMVAGAALSGVDRAKYVLLGTVGGVVLLLSRTQEC
ncbi:hypothetical protein [Chondromyces apiculatus]|uniref:Uncharacterized protein n=1 Tax=Chondromyces apiculatus DSM 436 TaxID=1192034 RepID=A0A017T7L5_9BACT|nr:hypothetical protein [Chondromyces apiculatus]EYF04972.1 Hypothetical protein CAP_3783 [Chondromyces apiculatus DSM 436]